MLGTEVVVGYGLTEIFQFALAGRSDDPGARPGVCGKPLAGVQVRLVDEDGDPVGVDEIGTLELQCGSLFTGYWGGSATASITSCAPTAGSRRATASWSIATASITTAAASTICSRSAASGCRRPRSSAR